MSQNQDLEPNTRPKRPAPCPVCCPSAVADTQCAHGTRALPASPHCATAHPTAFGRCTPPEGRHLARAAPADPHIRVAPHTTHNQDVQLPLRIPNPPRYLRSLGRYPGRRVPRRVGNYGGKYPEGWVLHGWHPLCTGPVAERVTGSPENGPGGGTNGPRRAESGPLRAESGPGGPKNGSKTAPTVTKGLTTVGQGCRTELGTWHAGNPRHGVHTVHGWVPITKPLGVY